MNQKAAEGEKVFSNTSELRRDDLQFEKKKKRCYVTRVHGAKIDIVLLFVGLFIVFQWENNVSYWCI